MIIIKQINHWQDIRDYCNSIKHLTNIEQAKCAKGRLNLWLQAEPIYSTGKYKQAIHDPHLWAICQELFPDAALAQIYYGNRGINWHRDAAYCQPKARILNLGNAILQTKLTDKITTLQLSGGELIEFNSKQLHKGTPLDTDRIGIGMWQDRIDITDPKNWSLA